MPFFVSPVRLINHLAALVNKVLLVHQVTQDEMATMVVQVKMVARVVPVSTLNPMMLSCPFHPSVNASHTQDLEDQPDSPVNQVLMAMLASLETMVAPDHKDHLVSLASLDNLDNLVNKAALALPDNFDQLHLLQLDDQVNPAAQAPLVIPVAQVIQVKMVVLEMQESREMEAEMVNQVEMETPVDQVPKDHLDPQALAINAHQRVLLLATKQIKFSKTGFQSFPTSHPNNKSSCFLNPIILVIWLCFEELKSIYHTFSF